MDASMRSLLKRLHKESRTNYLYLIFSSLIILAVLLLSHKIWSPLESFPDFDVADLLRDVEGIGFFEKISFSLKLLKAVFCLSFLFSITSFFIRKNQARSIYRQSLMISSLLGLMAVRMMKPLYQILPNRFGRNSLGSIFSTALFQLSYLEQEDFLSVILAYHLLVIAAGFALITFIFIVMKILRGRVDQVQWIRLRKGQE